MHGGRTRLRQELEKQRQESERRREENEARRQREMVVNQQTPSMDVPENVGAGAGAGAGGGSNQVSIEVPNTILEVRNIETSKNANTRLKVKFCGHIRKVYSSHTHILYGSDCYYAPHNVSCYTVERPG